MKKVIIGCVGMIFLLLFVTSGAYAQIRADTFSITPYIGGYTFEGNEDLKTRPVYGLRFGYDITENWGIEGALDYVRTEFARNNVTSGVDIYGYRVEALYHFMSDGKLVPFVAVGVGGRSANYKEVLNNRSHLLADYGIGLKYFLSDNLALRGDVRHLILNNDTQYSNALNNLEYTLGLSFYFGSPKPAPTPVIQVAEPIPPPPEAEPALPAPIDLTAKAVSESQIDLSWNAVEGATDYKIYRDGPYLTSNSTSALPDAGLTADTRYCYKVAAVDATGRESDDSNEACDTTLAVPAAMEEQEPEAEEAEEAMKEPEKEAEEAMKEPEKEAEELTLVAQEMFEKGRATIDIEFNFDKSDIKPQYHDEIKKFADVMTEYPDLNVIIEGHTDNIGGKVYNEKLSLRRATSVVDYMVNQFGIDASRLTAKGYGFSTPIATNKTSAGRQKNRRVEAAVDYMIKQ